jgi:hypothetical protein
VGHAPVEWKKRRVGDERRSEGAGGESGRRQRSGRDRRGTRMKNDLSEEQIDDYI